MISPYCIYHQESSAMKYKHFLLITGIVMYLSFNSSGQSPVLIKDSKVDLKLLEDPKNLQQKELIGVNLVERWLLIEVRYTPVIKAPNKNARFENMSIKYEIMLSSFHKGKNVYVLLSGDVSYGSVAMDNKPKNADAYISPKILKRYIRPGMKLRGKSAFTAFKVKVTFYNKNQDPLATAYYIPKGANEVKAANEFKTAEEIPEEYRVPDTVIGRNKSPWAKVNMGEYK